MNDENQESSSPDTMTTQSEVTAPLLTKIHRQLLHTFPSYILQELQVIAQEHGLEDQLSNVDDQAAQEQRLSYLSLETSQLLRELQTHKRKEKELLETKKLNDERHAVYREYASQLKKLFLEEKEKRKHDTFVLMRENQRPRSSNGSIDSSDQNGNERTRQSSRGSITGTELLTSNTINPSHNTNQNEMWKVTGSEDWQLDRWQSPERKDSFQHSIQRSLNYIEDSTQTDEDMKERSNSNVEHQFLPISLLDSPQTTPREELGTLNLGFDNITIQETRRALELNEGQLDTSQVSSPSSTPNVNLSTNPTPPIPARDLGNTMETVVSSTRIRVFVEIFDTIPPLEIENILRHYNGSIELSIQHILQTDPSFEREYFQNSAVSGVSNTNNYKTVMCMYYLRGMCNKTSEECTFAHHKDELRVPGEAKVKAGISSTTPQRVSRICPIFMEGGQCDRRNCPYSHEQRLVNYKTELCKYYANNTCNFTKEECRFAHGEDDLRAPGSTLPVGIRYQQTDKRQPMVSVRSTAPIQRSNSMPLQVPSGSPQQHYSFTHAPTPPMPHPSPVNRVYQSEQGDTQQRQSFLLPTQLSQQEYQQLYQRHQLQLQPQIQSTHSLQHPQLYQHGMTGTQAFTSPTIHTSGLMAQQQQQSRSSQHMYHTPSPLHGHAQQLSHIHPPPTDEHDRYGESIDDMHSPTPGRRITRGHSWRGVYE